MINHCSVWSDTCLGIFYFQKIATFSHPLFLWLKWKINSLSLGSLLFFFLLVPSNRPYNSSYFQFRIKQDTEDEYVRNTYHYFLSAHQCSGDHPLTFFHSIISSATFFSLDIYQEDRVEYHRVPRS